MVIDKEWRRRLKTLSERLDCRTPSVECDFALSKFQEIKSPIIQEDTSTIGYHTEAFDYDKLADTLIDKGIDTAILAETWFKK